MSDVFISYKAEDRRRIQPLVQALQAEGYSVWWDEQIGGGDAWRETIERQLDSAKCVIVIWSKRSVGPEGRFVRDEASRAMERGVYLPVRIDNARLPLGFGETQVLSLGRWTGNREDLRYQTILAAVERSSGRKPAGASAVAPAIPRMSRRTLVAGGAALGVAAAAGVGAWALLKPGAASASGSIAVLPFANLSGDPSQAYFSDGIAEEIRGALARIPKLRVMARTSSEAVRGDDIPTAAHKLHVANILTGSVRRSPTTIRVSAQLVDGGSGLERWSATYDRPLGDTLKIQSGIAESVANALSIELGRTERASLALGETDNAQAQDLVLQSTPDQLDGTEASLREALDRLDAAIALDPKYAQAWAMKGLLLNFLGSSFARSPTQYRELEEQASAAAERAIVLAPGFGPGRMVLATIRFAQLDFRGSAADYQRGLKLPGSERGRQGYASLLSQLGRPDEALRVIKSLERIDPLNPGVYQNEAQILYNSRRYPEALERVEHALQLQPKAALGIKANILIELGRIDEASKTLALLPEDNPSRLTKAAIIAAKHGDRANSDRLVARLTKIYPDMVNYQLAQIYAQRGETDRAFAALDAAWTYRDPGLGNLKVDPFVDPLRRDRRFGAMLRKLDFPS
jgi:serine/threonine-protein kinase